MAVCDVCGRQAFDGEAMIAWSPDQKDLSQGYTYRIACKDACLDALDRMHGYQYTRELGLGLFLLLHAAKTDLKHITQIAHSYAYTLPK